MSGSSIFFAHSGGVTAVVNAVAAGVIQTAQGHEAFDEIWVGRQGILGAIHDDLCCVTDWSQDRLQQLRHTPASAFGSCRLKLKGVDEDRATYERILACFQRRGIGTFFYNGGNDSQDTTHKIALMSQAMGYPLRCIGLPKTIDNDLPHTDCCPGFGSAAKYLAVSTLEAALDVRSMCGTSTKVFVLEVMGRHAGWLAAASALASRPGQPAPHLILLPEVPWHPERFLNHVDQCVAEHGYCVIVASEGLCDEQGQFLASSDRTDAFGHQQLGGVGPMLAQMVSNHGYKSHWAVADYLQRSAGHMASQVDVDQAWQLGHDAVVAASEGVSDVMMRLVRESDAPYRWRSGTVPLDQVANREKKLPAHFIRADGMGVTQACLDYMRPLIQGEAYPPYREGLPDYLLV